MNMPGIFGFRAGIAILLAFPACAAPPEVTPASDYREAWHAARASFARANSLLHEGLLEVSASDLKALVDAEDRLGKDRLEQLRSVTEEGATHAEAAIALRPDGVEGHLYLALNLAIRGLTRGRVAAMLEGLPGRIQEAYGRALSIDPTYAAGGAYRLKGKFLASAPWPVRDYAAAGSALERANGIATVRQNFLFLGDLRYREGRIEEAVAMWRRACETPVHAATAAIDGAVLELARRRVAAASQE
jgi:tetratricopeptide (TPR) repeat protein